MLVALHICIHTITSLPWRIPWAGGQAGAFPCLLRAGPGTRVLIARSALYEVELGAHCLIEPSVSKRLSCLLLLLSPARGGGGGGVPTSPGPEARADPAQGCFKEALSSSSAGDLGPQSG